jgi:hypothetical protein
MITKPTTRKPGANFLNLDRIETRGEDFPDGSHLEIIADLVGNSGLQLLYWTDKSAEISPKIQCHGRTYCPVPLSPSLLRNTRLPVGIGQLLEAAELNAKIANEFRKRIGLPADDSDRIAAVCVSSWFADVLASVPSLWISGEDAQLGMQLLRLATCFCRRPLSLGSIDRAGWNLIADFHPTLVIFDGGENDGVEAGLRTSSFRGLMSLDARGVNNFCAAKVVFSMLNVVHPSLIESAVQVSLDVAAAKANLLSDPELNRLGAEFQALLLAYRITNWQKVIESQFDVPEFTFPTRAIASGLGACVEGDRDLQRHYASLLGWQDDASRADRGISPESCVTEVLLGLVHLDPSAEDFQAECLAIQEIAKSLNTLLRRRGVLKEYSPEEVGWILKRLHIPKVPRDKAGVKIALGKETSSRVHALAHRYSVSVAELRGQCSECAKTQCT